MKKKYSILKYHQPASGRSFYKAKDVGCVTCLRKQTWVTSDRSVADRVAKEEGGQVVEEVSP